MTELDRNIEVIARLERLEGKIDVLAARVDGVAARTRDELDALFRVRKEHGASISAIEKDYVPRQAFDRHETEQREDMSGLRDSIDGLKAQVTKIMAIGGCLLFLANLAVAIWSKL